MVEDRDSENVRISKLSLSHDLDFDHGSGHTAYRRASHITYLPNIIQKNFLSD